MKTVLKGAGIGAAMAVTVLGCFVITLCYLPHGSELREQVSNIFEQLCRPLEFIASVFEWTSHDQNPVTLLLLLGVYSIASGAFVGVILAAIMTFFLQCCSRKTEQCADGKSPESEQPPHQLYPNTRPPSQKR